MGSSRPARWRVAPTAWERVEMYPDNPDELVRTADRERISALQTFLSDAGYSVTSSGSFDDDTENALRQYGDSTGNHYDNLWDIVSEADRSGALGDQGWVQLLRPYRSDSDVSYSADESGSDSDVYYPADDGADLPVANTGAGSDTMPSTLGRAVTASDQQYQYQQENLASAMDRRPNYDTYRPTEEGVQDYNVGMLDGRMVLVDPDGNPIRDADGNPVYQDTTGIASSARFTGSKPERAIFTMDGEGQLRTTDAIGEAQRLQRNVHHSSLARGENVAGAGEMKIRDGNVEAVSDKSGHYRPDLAMTAQVDQRLQDSGADTSKVTYELGNYGPGGAKPDSLVSGTELGGYNREQILADIRSGFWQQAEEAARTRFAKIWDRFAEEIKNGEIQQRYNALCAAEYGQFEAMDDRTLYAKARTILEGRHQQLRTVLDGIRKTDPADWFPDPLNASRFRWWDGSAWTANVTATNDEGRQITVQDAEGLTDLNAGDSGG